MSSKIALLITSIGRPELLEKCIQAWTDALSPDTYAILVAEQGALSESVDRLLDKWGVFHEHYALPYDCGISASRNFLVQKAHKHGIELVIMGADSILPHDGLLYMSRVVDALQGPVALIGFDIKGRTAWTYKLDLDDKSFRLLPAPKLKEGEKPRFQPCDICCNFFIAKTEALLMVQWDNELVASEHEDFFYRFGKKGFTCLWTPDISGEYHKYRMGEYSDIRTRNIEKGKRVLLKKYGIKKPFRVEPS